MFYPYRIMDRTFVQAYVIWTEQKKGKVFYGIDRETKSDFETK